MSLFLLQNARFYEVVYVMFQGKIAGYISTYASRYGQEAKKSWEQFAHLSPSKNDNEDDGDGDLQWFF